MIKVPGEEQIDDNYDTIYDKSNVTPATHLYVNYDDTLHICRWINIVFELTTQTIKRISSKL